MSENILSFPMFATVGALALCLACVEPPDRPLDATDLRGVDAGEDGLLRADGRPLLVRDHLVFHYLEGGGEIDVLVDPEALAALAAELDARTLGLVAELTAADGNVERVELEVPVEADAPEVVFELPMVGPGTYAVALIQLFADGELVLDLPFVIERMTILDDPSQPLGVTGGQTQAWCGAGSNVIGTPGKDLLNGTAGNDSIHGKERRDALHGHACNDALYGGGGQDTLYGGDGNDHLNGGNGSDGCWGGPGNDAFTSCHIVQH